MPNKAPLSIEVVDEAEGRFVIFTYANGDVVRKAVDPNRKPARRPRRPPTKLNSDRMDRTWKKRF